jgi:hypothetical protein
MNAHAIDHGSSRSGRWLRERRLRLVLWIAAVEGLLYLFGFLHWWAAVVLALIAGGFWWFAGRSSRSQSVRQGSWIFAATQVLVLCVPLALALLQAVAIAVIAILAVFALFLLFSERS